jgi:hypothetical protein
VGLLGVGAPKTRIGYTPNIKRGERGVARETKYRVIYFDEGDNEVYNEDFHTFNEMLQEGQPLSPPPNVKRTEVWMTHLLFRTPES